MRQRTESARETEAAGAALARRLAPGSVVCLYGDLGAGKTVFVKGMAYALGIDPADVISPSYTIIAEYDSAPPLFHADLYRLGEGADMEELGLYDCMDSGGITVIEWAERLPARDTENAVKVRINIVSGDAREIIIEGHD